MSPVQFILAPALGVTLGPFHDDFRPLTLLEVRNQLAHVRPAGSLMVPWLG